MDIEYQLLFFFSALGAFNGLILSAYFAFFIKSINRVTYFLSALILVISIRVAKSIFLIFYPETSNLFVQIGLTACFLIGPFLYIYVRKTINPSNNKHWLLHIIPLIIGMVLIGCFFPYSENRYLWKRTSFGILGWSLSILWLSYVIFSGVSIKRSFRKLFDKNKKISNQDFWLLNVVIGVGVIWLAYNTTKYTSYIMGAFSFSFILYLTILIWVFKRKKTSLFFEDKVKYANKRLDNSEANIIEAKLHRLFNEDEFFKNPQLKLQNVANLINEAPHDLSEYLNDNLNKSFSQFVNEYRIDEAKRLLQTHTNYTIEAIGYESGFNSKSTFFTAFKKITGLTPTAYINKKE
ncbi:helix-turn-helix domain-containing protein [Aquimarina megaterium]|uniref:helix-turn-helix domain-containing protein n=1 Tax=Aquimarina megaterium TaxID=1443666 RepID=UPI0009434034|nr:helix-turn-helix domain-containing protein [Aquimarina megaterium]